MIRNAVRQVLHREGLQPRFRFGIGAGGMDGDYRVVLPFVRSWKAIVVLLIFDLVFLVPAAGVFRQAIGEWAGFDSLFDLVGAVFMSAWLLGWSTAPLLITTVLVVLLFGREVVRAGPGRVDVHLGIPLLGVVIRYDPGAMRNLRLETPPPGSGDAWRGPHLAFDYGADTFEIGSGLDQGQVSELQSGLERATGQVFRHRAAAASELLAPAAPARIVSPPPRPPTAQEGVTPASALILVLANLVPLAGAAFFGWRLGDVMVLYWAESAIIGLFTLFKLAVIDRWLALLSCIFFLAHFSGFMAVHFLFIYSLFIEGAESSAGGGDLRQVWMLFRDLWPALLALLLSHGYSFFVNFMGRQEYRGRTTRQQMTEPYGRIVFMHLVLIIGGGLTIALGSPTPVLLAVIVLKTVFDIRAHVQERRRA